MTLIYFDRYVRNEYSNSEHTEPILINPDAITHVRTSKNHDHRVWIYLSNEVIAEVYGDLEEITTMIISATNGSISVSNNSQGTDRPNGKNGS